jgi:hypothetical protein
MSRNLILFSRLLRRYNEQEVTRSSPALLLSAVLLSCAALWLAACAAHFGPGYVVEKQEIRVSFSPTPVPSIYIAAEYHLKNTGDQELSALDVRLPGRRFHPADLAVSWDGSQLAQDVSRENPRDIQLRFPRSWPVGASHTLQFSYDISSISSVDGALGFSADAFILPSESWIPELPQARGLFGFGGVPPNKWELLVKVPQGFLVHASGGKDSGDKTDIQFRFPQTAIDLNPFVVAGRYRETRQDLQRHQIVRVWSRPGSSAFDLRRAGDSLSRTLAAYDVLFGASDKSDTSVWIVECPEESGCLTRFAAGYSALLDGENTGQFAEMISNDTVLVEPSIAHTTLEASIAPALAQGWLGYGKNPGFYDQQPPMSALPAFVAALARETSSGPQVREEIVQRALSKIPQPPTADSNKDPAVFRAKSLLLFYALRDRVSSDAFQKALQHMLEARHGRGFELSDLISALEQESHQPVGPFVREWIKRPGIPEDFRLKYSMAAASQTSLAQEATQ